MSYVSAGTRLSYRLPFAVAAHSTCTRGNNLSLCMISCVQVKKGPALLVNGDAAFKQQHPSALVYFVATPESHSDIKGMLDQASRFDEDGKHLATPTPVVLLPNSSN
jgi:hypothetical protein